MIFDACAAKKYEVFTLKYRAQLLVVFSVALLL